MDTIRISSVVHNAYRCDLNVYIFAYIDTFW